MIYAGFVKESQVWQKNLQGFVILHQKEVIIGVPCDILYQIKMDIRESG